MKRLALAAVIAASVFMIPEALAFQPGEKVTVDNKSGTVVEDTGKLVKVHIDGSGYSADVGLWYEKEKVNAGATTGANASAGGISTSGTQINVGNNASGTHKTGERIRVNGVNGTVLEDTGKLVKVHLDGSGYSADVGVWYDKEQLKNPSGASSTTASTGIPIGGTNGGISVGQPNLRNAVGAKTGNAGSHPPQNVGNQNTVTAAPSAPSTEKGVGAPPDGIYTCNKISGRSYIHIGTIEIRGRTYKGFSSQQGSFHPFTIDGSGSIIWTGGLTSLPEGWTLHPAKYVGPDYKGHPLIRVYYTSARGAAEVIDATKEK